MHDVPTFWSSSLQMIDSFFICVLKWQMHSNAHRTLWYEPQSSRVGTPAGIT